MGGEEEGREDIIQKANGYNFIRFNAIAFINFLLFSPPISKFNYLDKLRGIRIYTPWKQFLIHLSSSFSLNFILSILYHVELNSYRFFFIRMNHIYEYFQQQRIRDRRKFRRYS